MAHAKAQGTKGKQNKPRQFKNCEWPRSHLRSEFMWWELPHEAGCARKAGKVSSTKGLIVFAKFSKEQFLRTVHLL